MRLICFTLMMITCLFSCKTKSPVLDQVVSEPVGQEVESGPKILFITYKIKVDSINKAYEATLLSQSLVNGKLKRPAPKQELQDKDFRLLLVDNAGKALDYTTLSDPMSKTIEYVQPNGLLAKKRVYLDSTNIAFRIQVASNTATVQLELVKTNASKPMILKESTLY